ncbi:hypothetical protein Y032_0131g1597 [Ancylostoma ceylanicum]|uniref:Uncharacterized protein n=1 Tax=Ancylostoma ceylanicum TaxID=53326 RepID=A0A016T6U6_9BILA|nr:hypothetical protein Y032_0131g1597 [Ancylostoma ceylanicum]
MARFPWRRRSKDRPQLICPHYIFSCPHIVQCAWLFLYTVNSKRPWTRGGIAARRAWAEAQGLRLLAVVVWCSVALSFSAAGKSRQPELHEEPCVSAQERRAAVSLLVYGRLEFTVCEDAEPPKLSISETTPGIHIVCEKLNKCVRPALQAVGNSA